MCYKYVMCESVCVRGGMGWKMVGGKDVHCTCYTKVLCHVLKSCAMCVGWGEDGRG